MPLLTGMRQWSQWASSRIHRTGSGATACKRTRRHQNPLQKLRIWNVQRKKKVSRGLEGWKRTGERWETQGRGREGKRGKARRGEPGGCWRGLSRREAHYLGFSLDLGLGFHPFSSSSSSPWEEEGAEEHRWVFEGFIWTSSKLGEFSNDSWPILGSFCTSTPAKRQICIYSERIGLQIARVHLKDIKLSLNLDLWIVTDLISYHGIF